MADSQGWKRRSRYVGGFATPSTALFAVASFRAHLPARTGACSGTKFYCLVTVNDVKTVGARFIRVR